MRKLALLAGVAVLLCFGRPAHAQGVFADVPTDHWAYDAVNQLAAAGIFTGYPDQTFGGKRALTRYEFAVAIQRMLQDVQRRIEALGIPELQRRIAALEAKQPPNYQPQLDELKRQLDQQKAEQQRLQGAVDQLQRLLREFQDTLAQLGADVEQLKKDLAALAQRVGRVEEAIAKMPKITGAVNIGFIGQRLLDSGNPAYNPFLGGVQPTDIDGRPIALDNNLLQSLPGIYDVDLGITARLSDVATAHVLLNAGNYLKGYLAGSSSTNSGLSTIQPSIIPNQGTFDQVTAYYAYLDTPISLGKAGASITVGKFGQQFTPYTLKLVDVDSYFYNDKTDMGNYPILGGRVNFKVGGVNVQYYAGKHEEITYADLSSSVGSGPPIWNTGQPFFRAVGTTLNPLPPGRAIDGSQGARISFGVPLHGTVGATWLEGAGSLAAVATPLSLSPTRLRVWGADLNASIGGLHLSGEMSESRWKTFNGTVLGVAAPLRAPTTAVRERRAWDGRLGYRLMKKLDILGFYKYIGTAFDAPGSWGSIGRWKNPTGLEGYGGTLTYPLGSRMALDFEGARYRFIALSGLNLNHYRAGVKFSLTSSNHVDLGYERADYRAGGVLNNAWEQYYNIGWGHDFSPTTSFKLLYQFIQFRQGAGGLPLLGPTQSYDAQIAATQFSVRF